MRNEIVLQKLADWQPSSAGRHNLVIPDESSGWTATLTADRCDGLSCLVWELELRRTAPASATGDKALRAWADRIADRVTGLLEPLKVVEVDLARAEALLRSDTPTVRDNKAFHYEVHLRGTSSASLRRYAVCQKTGGRREQVAFALTHEAIAELTSDLTAEQ